MSICPKNKSSKARRDKRRANWKMSAPNLVKCSKCGALMMPHRVCRACGSYNKKEIIKTEGVIYFTALYFCVYNILGQKQKAGIPRGYFGSLQYEFMRVSEALL
jgi:large subunit ribosomal protein L32